MYELMMFFFSFNYHNFAFLIFPVMVWYLFREHNYTFTIPKDRSYYVMLLGTVFYMIFMLKNNGFTLVSTIATRYVGPVVMFRFGYGIAMDSYSRFQRLVIVAAFGSFLHGFLNILLNINVDVLSRAGRAYEDVGGMMIGATLQNLYFVVPAGLIFYFTVFYKRNTILRIGGILMALCGVWGSILNASRTVILLTGLLFFGGLALYLYLENEHIDTAALKMLVVSVSMVFVAILIYQLNFFHLQERLANSALGKRSETAGIDVTDNLRWVYAGDILSGLIEYPFGDNPYPHYAHNLWVDVAKEAGILPFLFYSLFAIQVVLKSIWMVRSKLFSTEEKVILVPIIGALIFVFFSEPIIQSGTIYFPFFCYLSGGLACMSDCAEETGMLGV